MRDPNSAAARWPLSRFRRRRLSFATGLGLLAFSLCAPAAAETAKPSPASPPARPAAAPSQSSDVDPVLFIRRVLADTEDVWDQVFKQIGKTYERPVLVLFTGQTHTACGPGQAISGPFYCPIDRKMYLDLAFFEELRSRFGAPGDMAQAYIIAHEVAHHIQNLLGIHDRVEHLRPGLDEAAANQLLVRQELQADCLAGVWAHLIHKLRNRLEPGDLEGGLAAAASLGNDRIQRQSGQPVTPETFTHGSSEQRVRWFRRGVEKGQIQACDTFSEATP